MTDVKVEDSVSEQVVADPAESPTSLTAAQMAAATDPASLLTPDEVPDIPDVAPPEEPDKVPEPEGDVTEDEEVEPEPEATDTDHVQKPEWDKAKQVLQQDNANLRKEVEALTFKLGPTEEADQLAAEPFVKLDEEFPEPGDTGKAVNVLNRKMDALSEQLRQRDNVDAYNKLLNQCCDEVGEEHRNEIHAKVQAIFTERGYGEGNYPDPDQTKDLVFSIGRQLQLGVLTKPTKTRKKPTKRIADDGKGGGPVSLETSVKEGTLAQVDAQDRERLARGERPDGWIE